ncbi:MAG: hypothetical protein HOG03_22360 [Desulfobacula sp.]|uniref:hypothetical protein n=1 Tax=Desulfobacula sp. TaxID=2593537 RepID=UPI001EC034C6|nr:hypothetical protein [Desulfobacula sp.]
MEKKIRRRRCKNCHDLYKPDYRNLKRQKFCDKPECKEDKQLFPGALNEKSSLCPVNTPSTIEQVP